MSDTEIIEKLAEFIGWEDGTQGAYWNPMEDWNDFRMVEERMMEDEELWEEYWRILNHEDISDLTNGYGAKADLPTRCKALVSILDSQSTP